MLQIVAITWSLKEDLGFTLGDYDLIEYKDLAAVVIHSDFESIDSMSHIERINALFEYHSLLERASIDRIILPVRFGTIVGEKREIVAILKREKKRLTTLLSFAADKAELDLMGIWREKKGILDHNIFEDLENRGYEIKIHKPANEAICFHLSILLTSKDHKTFSSYREELDKRLGDTIDLRVSEPLPPYSFLTLDLDKGQKHTVDLQS